MSVVTYLDHTQTVASQHKIVGSLPNSTVTKVKGLLPLKRRTRVCVRNSLLKVKTKLPQKTG